MFDRIKQSYFIRSLVSILNKVTICWNNIIVLPFWKKMMLGMGFSFAFALLLHSVFLFSKWTAYSSIGGSEIIIFTGCVSALIGFFMIPAGLGLFIWGVLVFLMPGRKNIHLIVAVSALTFVLAQVFLHFPFGKVYKEIQIHACNKLSNDAKPLITAVSSYTSQKGEPPLDLNILVPYYLKEIPVPFDNYLKYQLIKGDKQSDWSIAVKLPVGVYAMAPNFVPDLFVFVFQPPKQFLDGSECEKCGDWYYCRSEAALGQIQP